MRRSLSSVLVAACGASHAPATTAPSCSTDPVVVLAGQDDIGRFAGCSTALGITIRTGAALDTTPLHALEEITGDLVIGPSVGIEQITLADLRRIGGRLHVSNNGSLRGLFLPRLETVGRVEIDGNVALATIAMPHLASVAASVTITDGADLELVDMPALATIGTDLVIADHPKLALVEMLQLTSAASVRIENVPSLPVELIEGLRAKAAAP